MCRSRRRRLSADTPRGRAEELLPPPAPRDRSVYDRGRLLQMTLRSSCWRSDPTGSSPPRSAVTLRHSTNPDPLLDRRTTGRRSSLPDGPMPEKPRISSASVPLAEQSSMDLYCWTNSMALTPSKSRSRQAGFPLSGTARRSSWECPITGKMRRWPRRGRRLRRRRSRGSRRRRPWRSSGSSTCAAPGRCATRRPARARTGQIPPVRGDTLGTSGEPRTGVHFPVERSRGANLSAGQLFEGGSVAPSCCGVPVFFLCSSCGCGCVVKCGC